MSFAPRASRSYRSLFLSLVLLVAMLLSGCVSYDMGVNFKGLHQGTFVQHVQLGEQLTSFSGSEATQWLRSVERRARQLDGEAKRVSQQEVIVTIPFSNGKQLASKFNQFFHPNPQTTAQTDADLVSLSSQMRLNQNNLLLLQRNRLNLDVDLRALGVLSTEGRVVVDSGSLANLEFRLNTPWGARSVEKAAEAISPEVTQGQLVWKLQPGQINKIEAVFWLPEPLGIGAAVIALLMVGGFSLKYKRFPGTAEPTASSPITEGQ